jgi:hypothetical protein
MRLDILCTYDVSVDLWRQILHLREEEVMEPSLSV